MAELRGRLRLAQEARPDLAAERELRRQQLDRDLPLEPPVLGAVHDAHAAPPDLAVELVVAASARSTCARSSSSDGGGERVGHSTGTTGAESVARSGHSSTAVDESQESDDAPIARQGTRYVTIGREKVVRACRVA